jgi:4-hydroxy-tetrahydrodipicolinate reductase
MVNVCFAGVTGWTAPPIVAAMEDADDVALVAGVSRSAAGQALRDRVGAAGDGRIFGTVREALDAADVDVLVDYTSATAVRGNVWAAVESGVHAVIGSSGLSADDYAELDALARRHEVGVVAAGNFSVMAAVLQRSALLAAEQLGSWEVIDYASDTKADVPSGTAREVAESLAQVHPPAQPVPVDDLQGPGEARGADVAGTRVHSVRLPSFVVTTEVVFGGPGERLVLRHDPGTGPEPYAAGTLLAVRRVGEQAGVRRGLGSLLFDQPAEGR